MGTLALKQLGELAGTCAEVLRVSVCAHTGCANISASEKASVFLGRAIPTNIRSGKENAH